MTADLLQLLAWLSQAGCTHVAIESTGVYGRPVFNILEGVMEVILTNARDAKGYKARKTDVIDAEWLADLLRHGLLNHVEASLQRVAERIGQGVESSADPFVAEAVQLLDTI
jgi:transposase